MDNWFYRWTEDCPKNCIQITKETQELKVLVEEHNIFHIAVGKDDD